MPNTNRRVSSLFMLFLGYLLVGLGLTVANGDPAGIDVSPPTCDGQVMHPGDTCYVFSASTGGDEYTYAEAAEQARLDARQQPWQTGEVMWGIGALLLHISVAILVFALTLSRRGMIAVVLVTATLPLVVAAFLSRLVELRYVEHFGHPVGLFSSWTTDRDAPMGYLVLLVVTAIGTLAVMARIAFEDGDARRWRIKRITKERNPQRGRGSVGGARLSGRSPASRVLPTDRGDSHPVGDAATQGNPRRRGGGDDEQRESFIETDLRGCIVKLVVHVVVLCLLVGGIALAGESGLSVPAGVTLTFATAAATSSVIGILAPGSRSWFLGLGASLGAVAFMAGVVWTARAMGFGIMASLLIGVATPFALMLLTIPIALVIGVARGLAEGRRQRRGSAEMTP